jgi:hypothetical protein
MASGGVREVLGVDQAKTSLFTFAFCTAEQSLTSITSLFLHHIWAITVDSS